MERYTQKSSLTDYLRAGALAVTLLAGCGAKEDKIAPDPIAQHSLDMKVANAETVNGANTGSHLELDLSTPEKPLDYFFQALMDPDIKRGHDLYLKISDGKEFADFEKWRKLRSNFNVTGYEIGTPLKNRDDTYSFKATVTLNKNGKSFVDDASQSTICLDGKWLLANK